MVKEFNAGKFCATFGYGFSSTKGMPWALAMKTCLIGFLTVRNNGWI